MIYSPYHKIVGVGIPKTGTVSFSASLRRDDIVAFGRHDTAIKIAGNMARIGEVWGDYYTFTITRNPWDRFYSFYNFTDKDDVGRQYRQSIGPRLAFKEFVAKMKPQDAFFTDEEGNVMVDHVGEFSNLDDEFASLCERVGFQGLSLKHMNAGNYVYSREELFDDEVVDLISQRESFVIDLMGYTYDG